MNMNFQMDFNLNRERSLARRRELELEHVQRDVLPFFSQAASALTAIFQPSSPTPVVAEVGDPEPPVPSSVLKEVLRCFQSVQRSVRDISRRLDELELKRRIKPGKPFSFGPKRPQNGEPFAPSNTEIPEMAFGDAT